MKILVINGSPKTNGNTCRVIAIVEEEMKRIAHGVIFEYVHLSKIQLELCKGCYNCILNGEDKCPIRDDQAMLEQKMTQADAVIFASPVYVANVSALFKNFVDRFAYICHRPRFHGKKAMTVCSTGSVAVGVVGIIMKLMIETWGFEIVAKVGAIVSPGISEENEKKQWQKIEEQAKTAAAKFHKVILGQARPVAKLTKLYTFRLQQEGFGHADKAKADYQYWNEKGWLKKGVAYYIDAKVNPVKLLIARILASFEMKRYPKGNGEEN